MRRRLPRTWTSEDGGPQIWCSIDEISCDPAFQAWLDCEYPAAAEFPPAARRTFLKLMGASFALAGLTGCEKSPFVAALPYVDQPENESVGVPRYYATAVTFDGFAQPVIATTYSGRPTKLDGNPDHPATKGRSDIFMQAAVLSLYDPDRAQAPARHGEPVTWQTVTAAIGSLRSKWKADKGIGLRLLIGATTSPTLRRQLDDLRRQFPKMKIHLHESVEGGARASQTSAVYGRALDLHYVFDSCDLVVSFDDDFLGPGPNQVRNALGWSSARRRFSDRPGIHILAVESVPSATGAVADQRLRADASRMPILAQALANRLNVSGAAAQNLTSPEQRWIDRAAKECRSAGEKALIIFSAFGDIETALWVARVNEKLRCAGQTVKFSQPISGFPDVAPMKELLNDMHAGAVESLIILDCNPAYAAPSESGFAEALKKVQSTMYVGSQPDETWDLCEWQLALGHPLECWGDARAVDGTATIIQPTIEPFYEVRNAHQIVGMLLGEISPSPDTAVRETWHAVFGNDFDARWRQALHDGFVEGPAAFVDAAPTNPPEMVHRDPSEELDIVFRPDPTIWDGRFSNLGWLQELPKPLTTITWSNVIAVSPRLANRTDISNGDHIEITVEGRSVIGPAWVMPGQTDNTVALFLGYGRRRAGRVGDGLGYDAYSIRPADRPWLAKGGLRKTGTSESLAVTQLHHRMNGFDLVREVSVTHPTLPKSEKQSSLYPSWPSSKNAWGMVIDQDSCIGCNACVAACTAENNVPVVGREQVVAGREMHWLRIARYYTGEVDEPHSYFQPVPCMHCEQAPCEMGCPVHATTHSPEGVNQMVYNRCIGTRTCSSYCPYKVRRFNFYDYRAPPDSSEHAAQNPDVTVRSRGVMEKCTYCTQRIEAAHAAADKENRLLRDGEVITACQAACPTKAIVFGDVNDPNSEVFRLRLEGRHYALLEELGTRPRTTYLARWRDDGGGEG